METLLTCHADRLAYTNAISADWSGKGKCRNCCAYVDKTELRDHLGVYCSQCFGLVVTPELDN